MILKITKTSHSLMLLALLFAASLYGQAPSITSFSPAVVTQRTVVTITGTNFTGVTAPDVQFGGVAAASVVVNSPTQITAVVGTGASGNVSITNNGSTATISGLTYVAPAPTAANARITRVISDFNGYWNSAGPSANPALQPDTSHSLMGFEYGGIIYSTGSPTAISLLNSNNIDFLPGSFRALPVKELTGTVPNDGVNPNLIVLGSKIDGNPTTQIPGAPAVQGLSVRDVMIDGINGLDLGTGVTNLPASSVLLFDATGIQSDKISDLVPDIIVSQIADSFDNSSSVYCFLDANGNIVGNPVEVSVSSIPPVGRFKSDFFTLPVNAPLNTATVAGSAIVGADTRDVRLTAYKLSEFGINNANKDNVAYLKVMPGGTSDIAFMAYNTESFNIPAPVITAHPVSQIACTAQGNSVTFAVGATGDNLTYQWEKDGLDIPGATSPSYTIDNVQPTDVGAYRVLVAGDGGAALSNYAYLNTVIAVQPVPADTCEEEPVVLQVIANGFNISYQWYYNTTNSTTGGTLIALATAGTYTPPVNAVGTRYYYAVVTNNGVECASETTNAVAVTVTASAVAGTATGNTTICPGNSVQVNLSGYMGTIQWEQSTTGTDGWSPVTGGAGANSPAYTTPGLIATMYYRAVVSYGSCEPAISNIVTVNVNDVLVWTGNISTDWHTAGNWSCNFVPTLTDDILIPQTTNQPVVSNLETAMGRNLTIHPGASLTVNPENNLQILNSVNVSSAGSLILSSTANLIQDIAATTNTNAGRITVLRESSQLFRLDYTMWCSPVSGQNIFQFSPATVANRFYTYGSATDQYVTVPNLSAQSTSTFTMGAAYLIRMPNADATPGYNSGAASIKFQGQFKGLPYNGNVTVPVSLDGNRYNGVGNPYPSALNVWDFVDLNASSLDLGTLYFWRKKNGVGSSSYATLTKFAYNPNEVGGSSDTGSATFVSGQEASWVINPGQGFIVKAAPTATHLTFTNAMRRMVSNNQYFRTEQNDLAASRMWLGLTSPTGDSSQAVIGYSGATTNNIDFGWDGEMMNDSSIALYTASGNKNLSIEARAPFDVNDVVPLHYKAPTAGDYTIALAKTDGVFAGGQAIYLKDNTTGTVHDFGTGAYTFTTQAGTFANRFEVMYNAVALGTENPIADAESIIIYSHESNLHINAGAEQINNVRVYDTRGRLVHETNNINAAKIQINNLNVAQQVLIVQVTTQDGAAISKKVIF